MNQKLKSALWVYLILISQFVIAQNDEYLVSGQGISSILLENKNGHYFVTSSKDEMIHIKYNKKKFGENCQFKKKQNEPNLSIEIAENKMPGFSRGCKVNFTLKIPANISLKIRGNEGDINIDGFLGKLFFNMEKSNIESTNSLSYFDGHLASGKVHLKNVEGVGQLSLDSGDISVSYNKDPGPGKISLATKKGDILLKFPGNVKVNLDTKNDVQILDSDFKSTQSPLALHIIAPQGRTAIKNISGVSVSPVNKTKEKENKTTQEKGVFSFVRNFFNSDPKKGENEKEKIEKEKITNEQLEKSKLEKEKQEELALREKEEIEKTELLAKETLEKKKLESEQKEKELLAKKKRLALLKKKAMLRKKLLEKKRLQQERSKKNKQTAKRIRKSKKSKTISKKVTQKKSKAKKSKTSNESSK